MTTIKSYTNLEQSRKLAEIVSIDTADMWYDNDGESIAGRPEVRCGSFIGLASKNIPCWSLASLLNYLKNKNKFPEIKELSDGRFKLTTYIWDDKDCIQVSIGDSIVDACYDMILKLNELNLL